MVTKRNRGREQKSRATRKQTRPLLKWAGGKHVFVREIATHVPPLTNGARYYEPFAGAASLFLAIQPRSARLSDLNVHLMETYRTVRSRPHDVAKQLASMARLHCKAFYYDVREQFNRSRSPLQQAARFIYLNKAGFNGVYRVNTEGKFNVPHGKRRKLRLPSLEDFIKVSAALKRAQLRISDYAEAVRDAKKGDFVYLDPPYPPLNGSSFFTHYTKERFSAADQVEVARMARMLANRGVRVLVTNADTPLIRKLYKGWRILKVSRPRWVRSGKVKHQVSELIMTNYKSNKKRTGTRN